jgi:hypothetical protein
MRRHLEEPDRSTGAEWAAILVLIAAVVGVVFAIGWLVVAALSAVVGAIS